MVNGSDQIYIYIHNKTQSSRPTQSQHRSYYRIISSRRCLSAAVASVQSDCVIVEGTCAEKYFVRMHEQQ